MNQSNFVQFKKERDLGAMITDTFNFLRYEWKPFFTTLFRISIIPIILAIIAFIFFSISTSDLFDSIYSFNPGALTKPATDNLIVVFGSIFLYGLLFLVVYVLVTISSMYYIKSYIDNNGTVDFNYINEQTKNKFWSFIGLYILIGIMLAVGFIFCLFPGIYFWVVLSLSTCLLVFEKKGVIDSISDAFNFIKGHWWDTFGILLVVSLLVGVMNYITQVPATIYQLIKIGITFGEEDPTAVFDLFSDPIYIALLVFSTLVSFLLYTITLITNAFVYFDINEQKNASGSLEMIDTLGN